MFIARRSSVGFVLLIGIALTPLAGAIPVRPSRGDPAATHIIVMVPGKVDSFQNQQLEVNLHEYDPRVKGHDLIIDRHVGRGLNHNRGADTVRELTLGANQLTKPGMKYYVTVAVFDAAGKRTQIGAKDEQRGPTFVLTEGKPNRVLMVARPARPQDIVMDVADEIKKGNDAGATQIAKARAKDFEELYELENLYRPRSKRGMGWGSSPMMGTIPNLDGLENRLRQVERGLAANFLADAQNNEEAAYWLAAMAELTAVTPFEFRVAGRKTKADWNAKAVALRTESNAFIKAVADKNPVAIQAAAKAISQTCSNCHEIYRD